MQASVASASVSSTGVGEFLWFALSRCLSDHNRFAGKSAVGGASPCACGDLFTHTTNIHLLFTQLSTCVFATTFLVAVFAFVIAHTSDTQSLYSHISLALHRKKACLPLQNLSRAPVLCYKWSGQDSSSPRRTTPRTYLLRLVSPGT